MKSCLGQKIKHAVLGILAQVIHLFYFSIMHAYTFYTFIYPRVHICGENRILNLKTKHSRAQLKNV